MALWLGIGSVSGGGSVGARAALPDPSTLQQPHTLDWYRNNFPPGRIPVGNVVCFAEGTDPKIMNYLNSILYPPPDDLRYNLTGRWSGTQGTPRALTWSLVPDGTPIPGDTGEPSSLFSTLDSQFSAQGGRATWVLRFQQCFDRWEELTGLDFTRITVGGNDWDDGAAWGSTGSATRGDIRISMHEIDGPSNVLAYNGLPGSGGDMVIDRADNWGSSTNLNRFLRNTVMHESGHGIGMLHVCPQVSSKLMEPGLNTQFDGPRHDDIRGAQRHYGDIYGNNNTAGAATNIGVVEVGSPIIVGTVPPPISGTTPAGTATTSIDNSTESDYFRFTVNGPRLASVTVNPLGGTYDSCSQGATCPSGCTINSMAIANLNVQIIDTNGATVLGTAAANGVGLSETLSNVNLPAAGNYFVRVYASNTITQAQFYDVNLSVTSPCNTPAINPIGNVAALCGTAFNLSAGAGGTPPFTWSLINAPAGMTINSSGQVSWPNALPSAAPYAVTVRADSQCGGGFDTEPLNLTVAFGDFNGDGLVTSADVGPFVGHLLGLLADRLCAADLNVSGTADGDDVQLFVDELIP